ncbi:MAG: hypothetical protein HXY43_25775 [Fischerella sp.]|jgi:hypothetical protein|uniref:hypothetical protein n=1 Tax=unclassified Fischerella TaxID=494603 RepID=UPI00047C3779|nr:MULTISPECIES: hypothetical protein [unclassified Fischerella]NWF62551.1 hypothetical protein [Fischerella sp.]
MSEKSIEGYGKGYLVLLLPISFLIIFLVATWRIWLAAIVLIIGLNIWQRYQWQKWCLQVNPMFNQLIRETQGRITPMDLAIKGNFSGETAKRYLDTKASEFGASIVDSEEGSKVYYFMTASTLASIFDSSEPVEELPPQHAAKTIEPLLAPPPPKPQQEEPKEPETETLPQTHQEEVKKPLEKQLIFGSLIQSELAKRLNVYSSTVYKRRDDPDFPEWSRSRDPDGIAWTYSPKTKEFFPLEEGKS